ncbi:MAG: hypothetical protein U1A73_12340 [Pseudomonas sp.]|nr:hypothetical protein [Pseudomonas sp.]
MRLVPVLLLCLSIVACKRTDPASAPTPAVVGGETAPTEVAAAALAPPAVVELTAEQVAVAPTMSTACNLESVDEIVVPDMNPIEAKSRQVQVSGWALDEVMKNVPTELFVRVYSTSGDGRIWQHAVKVGGERTDVQVIQGGTPEVLNSGFEGSLNLAALDPGKYSLRVSYSRDGQLILCDNGRSVVLK